MSILLRIRQTRDYLVLRRRAPALPDDARARLTPAMEQRFRRLAPADQHHLLATFQKLRETGATEATCVAGLLHDIGKVADGYRTSILDRVAKVLLHRWQPRWLAALASRERPPRLLGGLYCAAAHPLLGARMAAREGYDPRVCWLIRHHEDTGHEDAELRRLIAADAGALPSSWTAGQHAGSRVAAP